MNLPINKILNGECLEHLKELPEKSINMCMTSPPYWALRDYGVDNQLGLEPTFDEYINKLCDIFDEVKRVLRDDGTCWVNIGDTYSATRWTNNTDTGQPMNNFKDGHRGINPIKETGNMPDKCLVMIPFRFAIEMVNRGWILRNTIIWHKRNCMPSSVKDRFTVDFEYLFLFSKNKKYYFETQYEPHTSKTDLDKRTNKTWSDKIADGGSGKQNKGRSREEFYGSQGRNKRTVWAINPKPFSEAHFAVYPEELCETPIKAGCPEFVCKKCGKSREKIFNYEKNEKIKEGISKNKYSNNKQESEVRQGFNSSRVYIEPTITQRGLTDCGCGEGFKPGIVLDPFFGSGTTGLVALKQNKKFIGIELNPEYIKIAQSRLKPYLEQRKLI